MVVNVNKISPAFTTETVRVSMLVVLVMWMRPVRTVLTHKHYPLLNSVENQVLGLHTCPNLGFLKHVQSDTMLIGVYCELLMYNYTYMFKYRTATQMGI